MLLKWIPVLALSALVAACGGGGDGGVVAGGGGGSTGQPSAPALVAGESLTGYFIDSPVSGLSWSTRFNGNITGSGTTTLNGAYPFLVGETVTFSLGTLELGTVQASAFITPLTLADTTNINTPFVVNLARLLQTLDTDNNPENGITLPTGVLPLAGLNLNADPAAFQTQFTTDFAPLLTDPNTSLPEVLIDQQDAVDHLQLSVDAITPSAFTARLFGSWRIFGSAQGADGDVSFGSVGPLGSTLTLREVTGCQGGARADVFVSCTTFDSLQGSWLYDESRRELVLRIDDQGEAVTDRCKVLLDRGGLIELLCSEVQADGSLLEDVGPAYLVRDVVSTSTAPSAASAQQFWFSSPANGVDDMGAPWNILGTGVFRFTVAGLPIDPSNNPVYAPEYNASTGVLRFSTFEPVDGQAITRNVSCTLYNDMELERTNGVPNRAFYAACSNSQFREVWILSPNGVTGP